jgi:mono/diheme cytochrome c family protein
MQHDPGKGQNMFIQTKRVFSVLAFAAVASLGFAGCGADLGECPSDAESSGQKQKGDEIVKNTCAAAGCHSSQNPAKGFDFTSDAAVKEHALIMYTEAEEGAMPPSGQLSDSDLEALRVYLACRQ